MRSLIFETNAGKRGYKWGLPLAVFFAFGLLAPIFFSFFMVSSPFLGLYFLKYLFLFALILIAFKAVSPSAPWPVRLVMSMVLGQAVLNYGFSNIVVGGGSLQMTLAEAGGIVGLIFLLPTTMRSMMKTPAFWVCVLAMVVPFLTHLYSDFVTYRLAALRDFLSVVDLVFFLGGMAVCTYGARLGVWGRWRNRFIAIWLLSAVVYGLTAPFSTFAMSISPAFQSYQQMIPVFGHQLSSPHNLMGAVAALFAMPHIFPSGKTLRF